MKWLGASVSLVLIWIRDRREFSVMRQTIRLARKVMKNQDNGLAWEENNHYSKVIIVFLVKNLHRLQSIQLLCRRGLAKDAVPLLRSMFEELADLNYMGADKKRVQDFVDYDTYQRYKIGKNLLTKTSENIDKERVKSRTNTLEQEWNKIKSRFTYKSSDGKERIFQRWTRENVRQICEQVGLGETYDYLFGYLSLYVHSSPISGDDFVLGRSGNTVVLTVGASPVLVAEILATSSGIYLDMLRTADKDFKMNLDESLKPVEATLIAAQEARRNRRNQD